MIKREPRPSDHLTQIHASALADGALSFKARGILAYLLACPPHTSVSAEALAKHGTDGERAVKSGLKELEEGGYLARDEANDLTVTDTPGTAVPLPAPAPAVRVGEPTPLEGPHGWQPSAAAMHTAKQNIELMDIPLSVTHYRIRAAELKRDPTSGEWLRWLIEDEKKARAKEREEAKANGHKKPWFAVAGD